MPGFQSFTDTLILGILLNLCSSIHFDQPGQTILLAAYKQGFEEWNNNDTLLVFSFLSMIDGCQCTIYPYCFICFTICNWVNLLLCNSQLRCIFFFYNFVNLSWTVRKFRWAPTNYLLSPNSSLVELTSPPVGPNTHTQTINTLWKYFFNEPAKSNKFIKKKKNLESVDDDIILKSSTSTFSSLFLSL